VLIRRVVVFVERKVDFAAFFLFYGPMVGKYALICAMEIQKIHMAVHIISGFALFTELHYNNINKKLKRIQLLELHYGYDCCPFI